MENKEMLIMYFKPMWFRCHNDGELVAQKLISMIDCESQALETEKFHIKDVKTIKTYIRNHNYKIILAFGEKPMFKKFVLERTQMYDNNYFSMNENISYKTNSTHSPCLQTRDMLGELSREKDFKWEFIHIQAHLCKDISQQLAQRIYTEMQQTKW